MTLQKAPRRALLVDRDRMRSDAIRRILEDDGIEVVERRTLRGALALLRQGSAVKALLLDVALTREPGLDPLDRILETVPSIPVVVLADDPDEDLTLEAVRSGAQGYLLGRDLDPTLVRRTVSYAVAIKQAEEAVQLAESMLLDCQTRCQVLFDLSQDAICMVDVEGVVIDANESAHTILGASGGGILGLHVEDLIAPEQDRRRVRSALADRKPLARFETTTRRCDGRTSAAVVSLVCRTNPLGEFLGFYLIVREVFLGTSETGGLYDALTGLPNRSLFFDRLNRVIAHRSRHEDLLYAVLFIDLDGFKEVNDALGHLVGDDVLCQAGGRLAQCIREGDTVARMGGDEFVVLLDGIDDIMDATFLADRFIEVLARPFQVGKDEVRVSCSVGITLGTDQVRSSAELLRRADVAMYQAKAAGSGTYQIYDKEMQRRITEALRLDQEVRRAVERRELTLRYQPVVDVDTGRVESFQALVHWQHADRGLVPAPAFLPTAEKLGLTHALSGWVVVEVCRQLQAWKRRHPVSGAMVVSIPFSTAEFSRPGFVSDLESTVRSHGLSPASLRLELSQSAVALAATVHPETLVHLARVGFRISVLDFGIGPSAWLALGPTPVDRLKIHRSSLALAHQEGAGSVTGRIAEVARRLGMTTTSEGVDTEDQLLEVRGAGSTLVQGLIFHEPLAPDAAEALLEIPEDGTGIGAPSIDP